MLYENHEAYLGKEKEGTFQTSEGSGIQIQKKLKSKMKEDIVWNIPEDSQIGLTFNDQAHVRPLIVMISEGITSLDQEAIGSNI